ncbi:MAG: hypothetical protein HY293_22210 [Planctomycetes bacterium]|nr:hypothetical protein [Planctomycetota bacterium]
MKSKGGSLYEVLKSASRPAGADDASPAGSEAPAAASSDGTQQATLQERLAAYKAAKLAAATQSAPAAEPARMSSATLVLEPDPTPIPALATTRVETPVLAADPTPVPAAPSKGPGERVVRLTYNTALFGGMVAVGLLFVSYAVGLHVGKGSASAETRSADPVRPTAKIVTPAPLPAPLPAPPPPPRKEYTIRLGEWKTSIPSERVKGTALAEDAELKKALERAGHRGFEQAMIKRAPTDVRLALYVDSFSDLNSEAAKAALTAMKTFRYKGQTPFAQAAFEEKQR